MKHIKKQSQPREFIEWVHGDWKDQEGQTKIPRYKNDMTGSVHEALLTSLVQEQGYLCCYTGISIKVATSHVEHIYPQVRSKENGTHEDIDYNNMLAAYPSTGDCPYGAKFRGDWYDAYLFVHPLRANCEQKFHYNDRGEVSPANAGDQEALETIRKLNLNHPILVRLRRRRIYEMILQKRPTKIQAERQMALMDQRDSNGRFREFCFVLKQVYKTYLK